MWRATLMSGHARTHSHTPTRLTNTLRCAHIEIRSYLILGALLLLLLLLLLQWRGGGYRVGSDGGIGMG